MKFVSNAFSLNMIETTGQIGEVIEIVITRISASEARDLAATAKSVIGHEDMAAVVSQVLGSRVGFNRETVKVRQGDLLLVAQYSGPRLQIGCQELPTGAQIDFYKIEIF